MSVPSLAVGHSLLAASGFEYALQQPLFPGKILLWLLFMLSLLSWAIMVSKGVSFFRMRRADAEFDRQFRASRQPLQLFERNYSDELSMQCLVYEHGAHEAAFQMLGSGDRDATFEARLKSADGMVPAQMNAVRDAFQRGRDAAASRIRIGLPILGAAAAGAPFLGLLGMVWILMKTFSSPTASEGLSAVSPGIAGGLAVMVVALLVSTPAIFAQILFAAQGRERLRKLDNFKDEAIRLMEGFYLDPDGEPETPAEGMARETAAAMTHAADLSTAADQEPAAPEWEPDEESSEAEPKEPAVAIRDTDTFESAPETEPEPELEPEMGFVPDEPEPEETEVKIPVPIGRIVDDMVQEEMPLSEIVSPFEAVEDGFLEPEEEAMIAEPDSEPRSPRFRTPFAEPEINPIAQQTAGILAGGTA